MRTTKLCSVIFSLPYSMMCDCLCADVHRNCDTLLHRRLSIVDRALQQSSINSYSYSSRIAICAYPTPPAFDASVRWFPLEYCHDVWYGKTRMVCYRWWKFLKMFIRFDGIHERDTRTDRRTLHNGTDRACIASRGKNDICIQISLSLHF